MWIFERLSSCLDRDKCISVLSQLFTKTPGDSHQQLVKLPSLPVKAKDARQLFVYKYSAIIQIPRHPVTRSSHGNLLLPYLKMKIKVLFDWSKAYHFLILYWFRNKILNFCPTSWRYHHEYFILPGLFPLFYLQFSIYMSFAILLPHFYFRSDGNVPMNWALHL